ncbi:DUF6252 family protein [Hymenobacter guriensis]|uniref:Uncharacterized protein n=1 Tax=Hymenobacter guriensis TaxID=2793065 RepID=A0ABS0L642_9BACT|nr:DUF6252 family protein [Hymenobacter guriensis]MBG8555588.1 hypothetical protein [Hymenobacter guriensis]
MALRKISGWLLSASLLLSACEKEDPVSLLPDSTQTGQNTGGFLLDGTAYPATGWTGSFLGMAGTIPPLVGGYDVSALAPLPGWQVRPEYSLSLNSARGKKQVTVTLYLRKPQVGQFLLNQDTGLPPLAPDSTVVDHATVYISEGSSSELYQTSSRHTGRIVLTVSYPDAAVSAGTFDFTAASTTNPSNTVTVSAGRFDRKQ